jgi:uncharacterized YigZ family protein
MNTITQESTGFVEEKKSKFYAFLVPYNQFEEKLNYLKSIHIKARHFVTAFRYLNENNQIIEGSSDDGEPKGSSGKPCLKVLQGHELINVGVIVVRYFGGTLLGVGGLVRAYGDSVNLAVANANIIFYEELLEEIIEVDYNQSSKCEYLFKKYNIKVIDRNFLDGIRYYIQGTKTNLDKIRDLLGIKSQY